MTYAQPSWPLLVQIGSGDSADPVLAANSEYVLLVEPDPELALRARVWLEASDVQGEVCDRAVGEVPGSAVLNRMSYAPMSSTRPVTGGQDLFPGVKLVGALTVEMVKPRDLLETVRGRMTSGGCALVIDAPSEALLVLQDLDEAGLLSAFEFVQLHAPSAPLHEGGADRSQIESWAQGAGYKTVWETQPEDPELVKAHIRIDWSARIERERAIAQGLREDLVEARQAFIAVSQEARSSSDLLEQVQTDLLASQQAYDQLNQTLITAREEQAQLLDAARAACADMLKTADLSAEAAELERKQGASLEADLKLVHEQYAEALRLREEQAQLLDAARAACVDILKTADLSAEAAELERKQGASLEADLKLVHEQYAEALRLLEEQKAAREKAVKSAEANLEAYNAERARRDALKLEFERLQGDHQAELQSVQRLSQELETLRDDNSLSLRIQRLAQADLNDLQSRYLAVKTEKTELERILEEFSVRLHQEVAQQKLSAPAGKKSSKKLTSKSKSKSSKSSKS